MAVQFFLKKVYSWFFSDIDEALFNTQSQPKSNFKEAIQKNHIYGGILITSRNAFKEKSYFKKPEVEVWKLIAFL